MAASASSVFGSSSAWSWLGHEFQLSEVLVKAYQWLTLSAALVAVLGGPSTAVAQEPGCDVLLTVEVSPGVPCASDDGFPNSLLNNHFAYCLDFLRQDGFSAIEVELTGPDPSYRCENVIESMRKDARVDSIRVEST